MLQVIDIQNAKAQYAFWLCILQLVRKMRTLYAEISGMLNHMEEKSSLLEPEQSEACDLQSRIMGLKEQLVKEKDEYDVSI